MKKRSSGVGPDDVTHMTQSTSKALTVQVVSMWKDNPDVGAGNQVITLRYASVGTEDAMPLLTHSMTS